MGYVAVKGGEDAIRNSKAFYFDLIKEAKKLDDEKIAESLIFAIDKIMSEGSLYAELLAAKAVKECAGDLLGAAFYLRAHRSACKRAGECETLDISQMRILRRISAAFKDIPGGQILGPSNDYVLKLLTGDRDLNGMDGVTAESEPLTGRYISSAVDQIRRTGLVKVQENSETEPFDITRVNPQPPYSRSAALQIMARGETGGMLAIAYTTMRGYGDIHPTVGDLRIGFMDINFTHPVTGKSVKIGEIRATSCEVVAAHTEEKNGDSGSLKCTVGFGFCFGFNETKALSMSILDNSMNFPAHSKGGMSVAENAEFVLNHIDGIESLGFCNHYKLPHYVTFQADFNVVKSTNTPKKEEVNE
jgi:alpha-D-ribose 1-methylphosphonate 5-triphosphate synthase subunit PhnI